MLSKTKDKNNSEEPQLNAITCRTSRPVTEIKCEKTELVPIQKADSSCDGVNNELSALVVFAESPSNVRSLKQVFTVIVILI
jgi:hypothetical protein